MANLYYDPILGNTAMQVYKDPQVLTKVDLEDIRDDLLEVQALSDGLRDDIARSGLISLNIPAFPGSVDQTALEQFDEYVDAELDRVRDVLDYFEYEAGTADFSIRTADWFLPEALEAPLPDDNGSDVVASAIDAQGGGSPDPNDPLNTTFWQSEISGERVLTVRLRDYTKRVEGIRLRTNSGDARAQLQGLEVRAANSLNGLNDPANIVVASVDLDDIASWFEIDFVKVKCRYLRLTMSTSNHTNADVLRIRSLQVRVGITNHDK